MKFLLTLLAVIYLGIELQAVLFLLDILNTPLSVEQLNHYERYGYASAGLGISLLAARLVWTKYQASSKVKTIATLTVIPVVYLLSVSLVYEFIHQVPDFVPLQKKPEAFSVGVKQLSDPSASNATLFYSTKPVVVTQGGIDKFLERYPTNERQVRLIYLEGLRGLKEWDRAFEQSYERMNKAHIEELVYRAAQSTPFSKADSRLYVIHNSTWRMWKSEYDQELKSPLLWPNLLVRNIYLRRNNPDWPIMWEGNEDAPSPIYGSSDSSRSAAVWATLRNFSSTLPARPKYPDDLVESVRYAHSERLSQRIGMEDTFLIPWFSSEVDHRKTESYRASSEFLTPFLFQEGTPLLRIELLRNNEQFETYINTLRRGLPGQLRNEWNLYHERSIHDLSVDANEWKNPVQYALNKDIIRIGVVLPWLVALSATLLLLNSLNMITTAPKWVSLIAAPAVMISVFTMHKMGIQWSWVINMISIQNAQIFII